MPDSPIRSEAEIAVGGGDLLGAMDSSVSQERLDRCMTHVGPSGAAHRARTLLAEWARIAANRSDVVPAPQRLAVQESGLGGATPSTVELPGATWPGRKRWWDLVDDADLDWRTDERARFVLNNLTAALAPTNALLLNPDALERAFQTGGRSVLRGWRNIGKDILHNHGLPRTVDREAFELGRNLAATPGAVVFKSEVCELIQYTPTTDVVWETPVVVVPPQINKYYVMDLSPGRSFIAHALERGFQTYAVSWRNPTRDHADWDLDTYVRALHEAVTAAAEMLLDRLGEHRRGLCRRAHHREPPRTSRVDGG